MQKPLTVYIEDAEMLPFYAHPTDAGMDVCAAEDIILAPGETKIIKTGLKMAIPEGYECQIRPRSGLSLKTPLRIANSPATIDAGYRDEIGVIMQNTSRDYEFREGVAFPLNNVPENYCFTSEKGNRNGWYLINKGDRIAQLVFVKVEHVEFEIVNDVHAIGEDRGGGFGSTGIKKEEQK